MTNEDALGYFDISDLACVLDGYEPRLARMVTETIAEIKDEKVFTVMFAIWIDGAREEVSCN